MKRIILDTNFVIQAAKIDFITELTRICDFKYGIFVIDKTMDELDKLAKEKIAEVNLAKALILKISRISTQTEKYVDDIIVDIADNDTIVATMDKGLKVRLKEKGIQVITIRKRKYLQIEG